MRRCASGSVKSLVLAVTMAFAVMQAASARTAEPRQVTVTGSGTIHLKPTIALINVAVYSWDKDLAQAASTTDQTAGKLLNLRGKYGIAETDITTAGVEIFPTYKSGDEVQRLIGYKVIKRLKFTLRDLNLAQSFYLDCIARGANVFGDQNCSQGDGIKFFAETQDEQVRQARALALKAARDKAVEMAAAYGLKLGRVISIGEGGYGGGAPRLIGATNGTIGSPTETNASGGLAPGDAELSETVNVVFELL